MGCTPCVSKFLGFIKLIWLSLSAWFLRSFLYTIFYTDCALLWMCMGDFWVWLIPKLKDNCRSHLAWWAYWMQLYILPPFFASLLYFYCSGIVGKFTVRVYFNCGQTSFNFYTNFFTSNTLEHLIKLLDGIMQMRLGDDQGIRKFLRYQVLSNLKKEIVMHQ